MPKVNSYFLREVYQLNHEGCNELEPSCLHRHSKIGACICRSSGCILDSFQSRCRIFYNACILNFEEENLSSGYHNLHHDISWDNSHKIYHHIRNKTHIFVVSLVLLVFWWILHSFIEGTFWYCYLSWSDGTYKFSCIFFEWPLVILWRIYLQSRVVYRIRCEGMPLIEIDQPYR